MDDPGDLMRFRFTFAALVAGLLVVSGGSMRAYAESAVFHDDHDDVVNLETRTQTSVQAGIDVRDVALAFTDRAVLLTVQHENLTERNAHEGRADYLILDTNAGDPGPEWSMELIGFHYQLYRVKSHAQASDPKRHMRRYCGDKVRIDTRENTTWMRFPASCAPRATQVRAYGRFVSDERGYAPRADNFLGYRSWTPWVSKG